MILSSFQRCVNCLKYHCSCRALVVQCSLLHKGHTPHLVPCLLFALSSPSLMWVKHFLYVLFIVIMRQVMKFDELKELGSEAAVKVSRIAPSNMLCGASYLKMHGMRENVVFRWVSHLSVLIHQERTYPLSTCLQQC